MNMTSNIFKPLANFRYNEKNPQDRDSNLGPPAYELVHLTIGLTAGQDFGTAWI